MYKQSQLLFESPFYLNQERYIDRKSEVDWKSQKTNLYALDEKERGTTHLPQRQQLVREIVSGFPRYSNSVQSLFSKEQQKINQIARFIINSYSLGQQPIRTVQLIGHADKDAPRRTDFEKKISGDRALAVQKALISSINQQRSGLATQITWQITKAGATQLIVPNSVTEQERLRNRRVEILLSIKAKGGTVVPVPPDISWIQGCLNRILGIRLATDGILEHQTRSAIRSFQQKQQLTVNGTINPQTIAALTNACGGSSAKTPDSSVADRFIEAHPSRRCSPGASTGTCKSIRPPRNITLIVIHVVATPPSKKASAVESVIASWQQKVLPEKTASAHYLVDRDGMITQMVRESDVAFHAKKANPFSIGIEHADLCNHPEPFTTLLYERSASLVRDIARRYKLPINSSTVVGHSKVKHGGGHEDPGRFWDWEYYFALLQWNESDAAARPVRQVITAPEVSSPEGWSSKTVKRGPTNHCATSIQPYGSCLITVKDPRTKALLPSIKSSKAGCFKQTRPHSSGSPIEFTFLISEPGIYKISLWWPHVKNANSAVSVDIQVTCKFEPYAIGFSKTTVVNQSKHFGQWNDISGTFPVRNETAEIKVSIRRDSISSGLILADAVRLLKTGSI